MSAQDEEKLVELISKLRHDPLNYAKIAFPWGKGDLAPKTKEEAVGLYDWQHEKFDEIGRHLRDPRTRFMPLLISVASGHGIGKTSFISMLTQWAMSTCVDCKITITANTETQLRTKTWPEIIKWFRMSINHHWFNLTATSVYAKVDNHDKTWRADAITWSENNTVAFQGLHNKGKRIVLIFDEASAIADKVWEVAEGALTDENTEIIWIAFGNPTQNMGRFKECFGKFKHRWLTKQIDSRTVPGTNKAQIAKWVHDYGEDSDFVRIRVKGEFPRAGSTQFIPSDIVAAARQRPPFAKLYDPLILGCDIARFGDDETVLCPRRGRDARSLPWHYLRQKDTMFTASLIAQLHQQYKFDAIFVDGGGVGGGVIDRLRMLKCPVIEVQFGGSPDRAVMTAEGDVRYFNKRAEMYGYCKDWLPGGSIPDDPDLDQQLTEVQYGYVERQGVALIQLEKKIDMKKRGLSSPDRADSLALTFAYPIQPSDHTFAFEHRSTHTYQYNPLDPHRARDDLGNSHHQIDYDPLKR